jgi:hypothetical protein
MDGIVSSTSRVSAINALMHSTAASNASLSSSSRSSTMILRRGELIIASSGISRIQEVMQFSSCGFRAAAAGMC